MKLINNNNSANNNGNNNGNSHSNINSIQLKKIKENKNVNEFLKARIINNPASSGILKNKNSNSNSNANPNPNIDNNSNKYYLNTLTRKIINNEGIQKSTQMNDSLSRKQNINYKYSTNEMHTNDSITYYIPRNGKRSANYVK